MDMKHISCHTRSDMLRSYSLVFSRSVFKDILDYEDFSRVETIMEQYGLRKESFDTYGDVLRCFYRTIRKSYCCEYVYKNEFITRILINQYGTKNTVAFNEFKVPPAIVDIALFNGESKAFEIKTEYDTPKRLENQLSCYCKLFDKCYVIIPESLLDKYVKLVDEDMGIIILTHTKSVINLHQFRDAQNKEGLDPDLLMKVLRTQEYKNIISAYYGDIPNVSCFQLYDFCLDLIRQIPERILRPLVLKEFKSRKNNTCYLKYIPSEFRQVALSLNLNNEEICRLKDTLNKPLIHSQI